MPDNTGEKASQDDGWEGFNYYPERRSNDFKLNPFRKYFVGEKTQSAKFKCERNVINAVKESSFIHLLMDALKSSGCPIDLKRHLTCEFCDGKVDGGYDTEMNQIVICENTAKSESRITAIIAHEMIHMFDYCRNDVDFRNLDHLACTEIRAAAMTHCSYMSAFLQGDASPIRIKDQHKECVAHKAAWSVKIARNISFDEAKSVVDKVFNKCYRDLEPVGRIPRRNSGDINMAYNERHFYGYT